MTAVPDIDGYRARVRAVIEEFRPQMPDWESSGHLPREFFRRLGSAGAFAERWSTGPVSGLPFARTLTAELAVANGGAALAVSLHNEVFVHALLRYGKPAHEVLLRQALRGEAIGCLAVTEASGGSEVTSTRAQLRTARTGWRLTGAKRYVTNGGRATHALVLARSGPGRNAFTLALVPLDRPGVKVTRFFTTLGMRSADTSAVEFDTELGPDELVGKAHQGLLVLLKLVDFERIVAATGLVAGARLALRLTSAYMRERLQFGARLFDHQSLRHRLAEHWTEVEAAAAMLDAACRPVGHEELAHQMAAAAKLFAARVCSAAIDQAIQVFGARGYTAAYPLERFYRDARLTRIGGGTDEMMREIVATHLDTEDLAMTGLLHEYAVRDGDGDQEQVDRVRTQ
jgi:alkylation response protein AidB-like acyl-CoA dehydrogenase